MKKEKFLKVGLSVLCTAVLAACGGSDDDTPSPTNTPTPTNTATTTPTATATPTPSAIPTTQAGAQLTEAERAARAEQLSEEKNSYVAIQHAKKIRSDVEEKDGTATSNATPQRVSQTTLNPSLDTIVVAVPSNDKGKVTYLEDFQFNNGNGVVKTKASSVPGRNPNPGTAPGYELGSFATEYNLKNTESPVDNFINPAVSQINPISQPIFKANFTSNPTTSTFGLTRVIRDSIAANPTLAGTIGTDRNKLEQLIELVRKELNKYAEGKDKYQNIIDPMGRAFAGKIANLLPESANDLNNIGVPTSTSAYKNISSTTTGIQALEYILGKDVTAALTANAYPVDKTNANIKDYINYTQNVSGDNYANDLRNFINSDEVRKLVEAEINRGNRLDERYILSRETGKTNLNHIYKKEASGQDSSTAFDLGNSNYRQSTYSATLQNPPKFGATATETNTQGTRTGTALVYQAGRRVYITDDGKQGNNFNYVRTADYSRDHSYNGNLGATRAKGDGINTTTLSPDRNKVRELKDTVAEVYGNKTFTYEVGKTNNTDYFDNFANDGGNNAPFTGAFNKKTGYYASKELKHVQYGRVTSAISGLLPSDLKEGRVDGTVVGIYGRYGADGTENTYFARGNNRTSNADIAKLSGNLTYSGHAVAYGLDNSYNKVAAVTSSGIPNAIGSAAAGNGYSLWSGNHVNATIDTSKKTVEGSINNIWSNGKTQSNGDLDVQRVDLVTFKGDFGANGNMIGTSEVAEGAAANKKLTADERKGDFRAALFGSNGEEMAGNVKSSSNEAEKAWGASFGAAQVQGSPWATQISQ